MTALLTKYRQLLAAIDSELRIENIKSMKFLCDPNLGTKKSSASFSSGSEIFDALEKNQKLSPDNLLYLCELLYVIGRVDLAIIVGANYHYVSGRYRYIDKFRVMLFNISEDLATEDLRRLRFLYNRVPKSVPINDGMDLFWVMIHHNSLSANKLELLYNLLTAVERYDLCEHITDFQTQHSMPVSPDPNFNMSYAEVPPVSESMSESSNLQPQKTSDDEEQMEHCQGHGKNWLPDFTSGSNNFSSQFYPKIPLYSSVCNKFSHISIHDEKDYHTQNIPVSMVEAADMQNINEPDQVGVHVNSANEPADDDDDDDVPPNNSMSFDQSYIPLEYYKMDTHPRGICLVIDNKDFKADPSDREAIQNLQTREGTTVDRLALKRSFERLHFQVEIHENLTDVGIFAILRQVSSMDHQRYDCFICCILSHGGESHIYGVNGRKVQLGDITSLFRAQSCPTLARKPKLFFMASCRGKVHQPGVSDPPPEPMFDRDMPEVDFNSAEWVPNEADFLFGYSTVVNYVSYRSKSQGTFYINELTKVLDKFAHREELQKLLLRVNAAVTSKIYSRMEGDSHVIYKQTPAPQHTLTKQLKFI